MSKERGNNKNQNKDKKGRKELIILLALLVILAALIGLTIYLTKNGTKNLYGCYMFYNITLVEKE